MSRALLDWQRESGLSPEGLAALLEERCDREVPVGRVQRWLAGRTSTPKYVLEALGIEEPVENVPLEPLGPPYGPEMFREGDESPAEPDAAERLTRPRAPGRELAPVVPDFDVRTVREVLVTAYQMVGKGAQYAARPDAEGAKPDYVGVFDAHAEKCADAWIELAKRDAKVARVLVSLTAGGAWGHVILLHGSLVVSLLVVSGKVRLPEGGLPLAPEPEAASHAGPHEPTPAV